jgi:hypothetical protein
MQRCAAVLYVLTLSLASVGVRASDSIRAIVDPYLEIQTQLAADKVDGIKARAQTIAARAAEMGEPAAAILNAANLVERAADLKAAREAFGQLSDAVIAAAKADRWKDLGDIKLAYCPMAKRYWLQKDEKIRNPYYGSSMLECGEFREPSK